MKTIDDLIVAVEEGKLKKVKSILKNNPELVDQISATGYAPIHGAVHQELFDMVELLIEAGADVNNWGGNRSGVFI